MSNDASAKAPNTVAVALIAAAKAALITAALAFPIVSFKLEPDFRNVLVLQERWSWLRAGELVHDNQGKRQHIQLTDGDKIMLIGEQLQIVDCDDIRKYHISGFDSIQEATAAKAILQGQALGKRHVNIKMSND